MADDILMQIMVEAYPVVIFTKQLEDGSRKIMQIIEGEDYTDGKLQYRTLYQYNVEDNRTIAGKTQVFGEHKKLNPFTDNLKKRLLDNGISQLELKNLWMKGGTLMQWIQIIILCCSKRFFTLFDIRFTDLLNLLAVGKKSTLNDDIDVLLGKPAKGFFNRESVEIEQLLKSTGRENRFTMVKRISVLLFSLGAVVSLLLNNPFLIPILEAGFALAPVWYLRATASVYKSI